MTFRRPFPLPVLVFVGILALTSPATAAVKLMAKGTIPANATDKSGLTDKLEDGTPHNRLGSCGSAIAYTGTGSRYVLLADRGPKDGTTHFYSRFHLFDIMLEQPDALKITLQDTKILKDKEGRPFVGQSSALTAGKTGHRLDPEGVRVAPGGRIYVSDEYGPHVLEFSSEGRLLQSLPVPQRFLISNPNADPKAELTDSTKGRVPNRGMEGLAIDRAGRKLYACMQGPLIQDGGRDGTNVRLLELNLETNATREFVYRLEGKKTGVSEIVAVNGHEFLVIERGGSNHKNAKIYKIDISKATDVSKVEKLPENGVPDDVVPVTKSVFLDLLDPRLGLAGQDFPTKVEGLAFGPDLPDGRHLLLVSSDNDLTDAPTYLFAFAIDPADLPGYQPQQIRSAP